MSKTDESINADLINLYYSSAVDGIKIEWLKNKSEDWYLYISNLPEKEKVTYHIAILDEEVSNGGFHQYFTNGYGQFAKDTIISLQLIKANASALILNQVLNYINHENLDEITFRKKIRLGEINNLYYDENLKNLLNDFDDKYSDYEDDIGALLGDFLKN